VLGNTYALLDDVRAEFLNREGTHIAGELPDDRITKSVVVQIEDVLHDIVAVWVLDKCQRVVGDLVDELDALGLRGMINATLKDTASMAVGRDFDAISSNGIIDELIVLGSELVETLLNYVVTVEILD
jgi:hypothetical protein